MEKNNIVESWDNFGFLHGLEGDSKEKLAVLFENLANEIIQDQEFTKKVDEVSNWTNVLNSYYDNKVNFDVLEVILFPILRRVFVTLDNNVEWDEFYSALLDTNLDSLHKSKNKEIQEQNLDSQPNIDYEATLCAMYADIITAKIMIQRKK